MMGRRGASGVSPHSGEPGGSLLHAPEHILRDRNLIPPLDFLPMACQHGARATVLRASDGPPTSMQERHARAASSKEYPAVDRAVADLLSSEWSRDKATSLVSKRSGRGKSWPRLAARACSDRKPRQRVDLFFALQEATWQVHVDDEAHGGAEAAGRRRCAEAPPEARPALDRAAHRGRGRSAAAAAGVDRVRPRRAARLADAGARRARAAAHPPRPTRLRAARRAPLL